MSAEVLRNASMLISGKGAARNNQNDQTTRQEHVITSEHNFISPRNVSPIINGTKSLFAKRLFCYELPLDTTFLDLRRARAFCFIFFRYLIVTSSPRISPEELGHSGDSGAGRGRRGCTARHMVWVFNGF